MNKPELPVERIEGEVSVSPTGDVVIGVPTATAVVVLSEESD